MLFFGLFFSCCILFPCILPPPPLCMEIVSEIFIRLSVYLSAGYQTVRVSSATLASLKGLWVFYCASLNLNLVRQGRDSKQKLSCVSQLPSYQSQDLISFLKGPIVFHKDCEIVTC